MLTCVGGPMSDPGSLTVGASVILKLLAAPPPVTTTTRAGAVYTLDTEVGEHSWLRVYLSAPMYEEMGQPQSLQVTVKRGDK
jgi:hypothetical protein